MLAKDNEQTPTSAMPEWRRRQNLKANRRPEIHVIFSISGRIEGRCEIGRMGHALRTAEGPDAIGRGAVGEEARDVADLYILDIKVAF